MRPAFRRSENAEAISRQGGRARKGEKRSGYNQTNYTAPPHSITELRTMARLAFLLCAVTLLAFMATASSTYWNQAAQYPPPPPPPRRQQAYRPQAQHYPMQYNAGPYNRPQGQNLPHQIQFPHNQYSPPAQNPGGNKPQTNPNNPNGNDTDFVTAIFDGRPDSGTTIDGRGRTRPRM